MSDLKVDYHMLRRMCERLGELYLELSAEMEVIVDKASVLDIFWDGDANAVFMQSLGEDLVEMGVIMMSMKEAMHKCRKAMEIYMQNEKEIKNLIGELKK